MRCRHCYQTYQDTRSWKLNWSGHTSYNKYNSLITKSIIIIVSCVILIHLINDGNFLSNTFVHAPSFLQALSIFLTTSFFHAFYQFTCIRSFTCPPTDCSEHGAKLKFYCRECKCICCSHCQTYGHHKGHSTFEVHEAEEQERKLLSRIQARVEQHAKKFIKARAEVQKTIEEVKKDSIVATDVARRY